MDDFPSNELRKLEHNENRSISAMNEVKTCKHGVTFKCLSLEKDCF